MGKKIAPSVVAADAAAAPKTKDERGERGKKKESKKKKKKKFGHRTPPKGEQRKKGECPGTQQFSCNRTVM